MYLVIVIVMFIISWIIYDNETLKVTKYHQYLGNLPKEFDGFNIVQISDLHNRNFGENQSYMINKIKKLNPDIVVFTGDLIDYHRFDMDVKSNNMGSIELIKGLRNLKIPMYMVYGNHETKFLPHPNNHYFIQTIQSLGVKILNSDICKIYKDDKYINLLGIQDPYMFVSEKTKGEGRKNDYTDLNLKHGELLDNALMKLQKDLDKDKTNVLICHRPELLNIYSKYSLDLVLTGHAHGGQFRIPFIGGLYSPHQGKFPKYTSGIHKQNNTNLIISRGIGNSSFPIRLNNRPEIVLVSLKMDS